MIKPIDEIPQGTKRKPQTVLIREDIEQAIRERIDFFEFVDEAYNKKYLKQYVMQVADEVARRYLHKKIIDYKNAGNAWPYGYINIYRCGKYMLEVSRMKDKDGELHIYGKIRKGGLEEAWGVVLARAKILLEMQEERERKRKVRR